MLDRELAAGLLRRDPQALGAVYDAYADRLFTYAVGQAGGDREAAADAVSDTFLLAYERIGQLRDPDRLRPWLYAITRSECLRRHRSAARTVAFGEEHDVIAGDSDLGVGLERAEARALVAESLASLNDPDREVLELALRHDLDATAVGAVMSLSPTHVGARISRARKQLEVAVVCALFVRTKGRDCPELAEIVAGADGVDAKLLRKRVTRHIDNCDECGRRRPAMVAAIPSLGVLPLVAAPQSLREAVLGSSAIPGTAGAAGAAAPVGAAGVLASDPGSDLARRAAAVSAARPPYGPDGFPEAGKRRRGGWWWWAAAAVLLLVGVTTVVVARGGGVGSVAEELAAGAVPQAGAVVTSTPSPTATPSPSASDKQAGAADEAEAAVTKQDDPQQAAPAAPAQQPPPVAPAQSGPAPAGNVTPKPTPTKSSKPKPTPKPTPTPNAQTDAQAHAEADAEAHPRADPEPHPHTDPIPRAGVQLVLRGSGGGYVSGAVRRGRHRDGQFRRTGHGHGDVG